MTEPLCLTDLHETPPGLRRLAHGYATSGTWRRLAVRIFYVGRDVIANLPRDLIRAARPSRAAPLRMEDGVRPAADAKRIALYVHYSPGGQVSDMVRRQLALLGGSGVLDRLHLDGSAHTRG